MFSTYWIDAAPYVKLSENFTVIPSRREVRGLIPQFLTKMVDSCCQTCAQHGRSYLDFREYDSSLDRKSFGVLTENVQKVDFTFPVHGTTYQTRLVCHINFTRSSWKVSWKIVVLVHCPIGVRLLPHVYVLVSWRKERLDFVCLSHDSSHYEYLQGMSIGHSLVSEVLS